MDKNTYGRSPAAMYLALYVSTLPDADRINRKIATTLTLARRNLNELFFAHTSGVISLKTISSLINLISENLELAVQKIPDPHARHLTLNVLQGDVKVIKRRLIPAINKQKAVNRVRKTGEAQLYLICAKADLDSEANYIETLKARSKAYLARKGKEDSIY